MAYRSVSCALLMEKLNSEHSLTKGISYKERHSGIFGSWKEMRPWYFCKGGKRFKKDVSLLYYAYLEIYFEQSLFIVWWCMPLIPALRKQRQENQRFMVVHPLLCIKLKSSRALWEFVSEKKGKKKAKQEGVHL